VVIGWRGPSRDAVAYAWELGSHGGVAPEELTCFAAHPPGCPLDFERVVRPRELHAFFEAAYRGPLEEAGASRASGPAADEEGAS
jgi:hypothetical protein